MDECVETLKTHPDALPTDRQAIWWVKLAFIMEDASTQLSDDTEKLSSFVDSKVRYTIRGFSNQLSQWRRDIPDDIYSGLYLNYSTGMEFLLTPPRRPSAHLSCAKSICT